MTCLLIFVSLFIFIRAGNSHSMQGHVVGGEFTEITKFPHSVYLQIWCDSSNSWICGASVLNQMMVLTAAHCFEDVSPKCRIDAMVGDEDLDRTKYVRNVRNFTIHENYSRKVVRNDIALGHLTKKLPLGRLVQRVMITDYFPEGSKLSIAGWGTINDFTQEVSLVLKKVDQHLLSRNDCGSVGNVDVGMFCASNSLKDRPSKGDSGSALVIEHGHQVGLVSFRTISVPEVIVYTNTSYYFKWIGDTAWKLHCSQNNTNDIQLSSLSYLIASKTE